MTGTAAAATLDAWIDHHGPVDARVALVLALQICVTASHIPRRHLGEAIETLHAAAVRRSEHGAWSWTPSSRNGVAVAGADSDVISRLGLLMFYAVAGRAPADPFASEATLRESLRALRPDLPASLVDLIARTAATRHGQRKRLDRLAREIERHLGLGDDAGEARQAFTRATAAVAMIVVTIALVAIWWTRGQADDIVQPHGLTSAETVILDIDQESAQTFAMVDEHTAAIQIYQTIGRLWRSRLPSEDSRLAWTEAHEAWVRTLAGDRLTTEQIGERLPARMAGELGEAHPYTRAVRLELADTLAARGAAVDGAAIRDQAERATQALFPDRLHASDVAPGVPAPPGVVAHMAPNDPIREGFRLQSDGRYAAPLTSIQRWLGGRDGWRMHVVARGECEASVVTGNIPRRLTISLQRATDAGWDATIQGVAPPLTIHSPSSESAAFSIRAEESGAVVIRGPAGDVRTARIDAAAATLAAPHMVAFRERAAAGCALVWIELPIPFAPSPTR